jgi:uncharacterized protein YndB with AHSA1/START domain
MGVQIEANGRRSVQIQLDVPGSQDIVWRAIATGPGISSWFVPAEMTEENGTPVTMTLNFGPGMVSSSTITAWDPPRMFAKESAGWMPGSPSMITEWLVQPHGQGCRLYIVHSLVAETDAWDHQLEGAEVGWGGFLRTLTLYLTHFPGQPCTLKQWLATTSASEGEAWEAITTALGLNGIQVGHRCSAPESAPTFAGLVEYSHESPNDLLVRLDSPAPGIAALGTYHFGNQTTVGVNFYLYGQLASEQAQHITPQWQNWIQTLFPPAPQKVSAN